MEASDKKKEELETQFRGEWEVPVRLQIKSVDGVKPQPGLG